MTREKALELLKGGPEGVKKWNQWRADNLVAEIPSLNEASLSGAHLEGANLSRTHLKKARLGGAHLEGANLCEAHLEGAIITDLAHLEKAWLFLAHLEGADLTNAHLEGADLTNARLEKASLWEANLKGANLRYAHLEGADLRHAHLEGADLTDANLEKANLGNANIERANLRGAHLERATLLVEGGKSSQWDLIWPFYPIPYKLDRNYIRNTEFHSRARDPWSVLRRSYTGSNMVFVLLFTLAAFLPVIAKATFWSAVSRWQEAAAPVAVNAVQRTSKFLAKTPGPAWTPWVEKAQAFLLGVERERMTLPQVRETLELLASSAAAIETFRERASENAAELEELRQVKSWVTQAQEAVHILAPDGEIRLRERRVLSLVLGTEDGWHIALFSAVLLLYNVTRAFLTYRVGPLRDDEERVGVSPAWAGYKPLWRLHQVTSPVLAVSVLFGIVRILSSLWATVLVPG